MVSIYLSHAVRGKTGTPEEIAFNCKRARAQAAFIRTFLGPGYDVYCPADGDESLQIAWNTKILTINQIMEIDRQILKRRDIVLAMLDTPSQGVQMEIDWGVQYNKSIFICTGCDDLVQTCERIKDFYGQ